jgi:hypothetical protein
VISLGSNVPTPLAVDTGPPAPEGGRASRAANPRGRAIFKAGGRANVLTLRQNARAKQGGALCRDF